MATYPLIPAPPLAYLGEPVALYGARVLKYLIETDCPAEVSNEDLDLADHAAAGLCGADYPESVRARISAVRHLIAATIRRRQLAEQAIQAGFGNVIPPGADRPNEGPMAELIPAPRVNPPAPAYARPVIDIAF